MTYIALVFIAASIYGLVARWMPEKIRNGLYIPLLLGIALLGYVIIKSTEKPHEVELVTGEFTVPAYQSRGIPYVNYMSFPITVDFFADGQWSTSGHYHKQAGPEGAEDEAPADGRYRLPGAKVGALILKRKTASEYEHAGRRKTLKLEPKEEVLFMINDYKTDKAYSDNYGEIKVRWVCNNCRSK
jgi:hypothetical protein